MRRLSLVAAALSLLMLFASAAWCAVPNADWFPQAPALVEPAGEVIRVSNVEQLFDAVKKVKPGGSILLADGHYRMPLSLQISTDNVTLRGASGDRTKVVLDGAASRHGELIAISDCAGVTIADLTVQNVKWNGIKINSDRGAQRVTVHNCVLHNIWQRGVKAPGRGKDAEPYTSRDCQVRYCLFYNDRPKQFSDDEVDTPKNFNGNYIGGIDVKHTVDWKITDNVFIGIQGRTREGRGCIYISEDGRGCQIERNIFLDCDIAIALGNPSLEVSEYQAVQCVVRNNLVANCPETGILACITKDCAISNNTIYEPQSAAKRLIWVQQTNDGLRVENNLLVGAPVLVSSDSKIVQVGNVVAESLNQPTADEQQGVGQNALAAASVEQALTFYAERQAAQAAALAELVKPGLQSPEVIEAMCTVHEGFQGQPGYVAQFGDSITHSLAFWSPMDWDAPEKYLPPNDELPPAPHGKHWRDYLQGARDKGGQFANASGWKVGNVLQAMDGVLQRNKPEVAIIMVGTNDVAGGQVPDGYRDGLRQIVQKCLDAHCVPILNTIPPRRGRDSAVEAANEIIRDLAREMKVPLADYHAECLRLRPDQTWQGTIISADGVHPTAGQANVYTEENLKNSGYALRNWVNFLVLRQLYFRVLHPENQAKQGEAAP